MKKYQRLQGEDWHSVKNNFRLLYTYKSENGNIKGIYTDGKIKISHWLNDEEKTEYLQKVKDISNVIGKVDSKNETQIKKEIEQVGYKEFYRYYKEKDIYINQLKQENQKCKEVIDKLKEFIESKNNGVCVINGKEKEAFTFLLDFDKAREFIWKLLDILKEVE